MTKKILICGDSFSADWSSQYQDYPGWPNLLENNYKIVNVSQAGASEYKIWLQVKSQDITDFDFVIISHSSPFRVFVRDHPIHRSGLHADSDLIFNDIDRFMPWNRHVQTIRNWFRMYFDEQYHHDIYCMIRKEIMQLVPEEKYICTSHSYHRRDFIPEIKNIDFTDTWVNNRGIVNHYTPDGNQLVYQMLLKEIQYRTNKVLPEVVYNHQ
jgi:hypothetical protein